eukprot:8651580-Pyramimonas_sp.AAC.1
MALMAVMQTSFEYIDTIGKSDGIDPGTLQAKITEHLGMLEKSIAEMDSIDIKEAISIIKFVQNTPFGCLARKINQETTGPKTDDTKKQENRPTQQNLYLQ